MDKCKPTHAMTLGKKKVGGYILGDTIGEGSFAKVRVGTHVVTQERVAIKIIDKRLIVNRDYVRKNLRREAAMLGRLNHVNITKLYEVLETENNYYLVMELADGGEFMRYLCQRRRLSERDTRKYMRQLVSSIEYMHQAELVHRDIKIENFLLDSSNNLKVIDFGLSNVLGPSGFLNTQCGSPAYAAPEIFSSNKYGPAVDVWSIGVNMFAMLTGELPFSVDPPNDMFKLHSKILQGCTFPEYLTKDCRDLMSRLLTVDEDSRIKLRDVMKHSWMNHGYSKQLRPSLYPNKPTADDLNTDVLEYMSESKFSIEKVVENIVENRPSSAHAMYHLLVRRQKKGLGFPDLRCSNIQSIDKVQSDISYGCTGRVRTSITGRSNSGPEDKNKQNKLSCEDIFTGIKHNGEIGARNGVTLKRQVQHPKTKVILEDVTHCLREIDLNKNKNDNNNSKTMIKNLDTKIEKPKSVIKTKTRNRVERTTLDCLQLRINDFQTPYVEEVGQCNIDLAPTIHGLLGRFEGTKDSRHRPRSHLETHCQQTFKPVRSRPRLQRSTSHSSSDANVLTSHQNDQCYIIVNNGEVNNCLESSTFKRHKGTMDASLIKAKHKERLRRSNTDPSIYNSFTKRQNQEYSSSSQHGHMFPIRRHLNTVNQLISGATFGFPTRLRSLGRHLGSVAEQQNITNIRSALKTIKGTSNGAVCQNSVLPTLKQEPE